MGSIDKGMCFAMVEAKERGADNLTRHPDWTELGTIGSVFLPLDPSSGSSAMKVDRGEGSKHKRCG